MCGAVAQCLWFTFHLLVIHFHATKAATHWVVTEDGKLHTQDDSIFQMRHPYDLMSLLQQEKRVEAVEQLKSKLRVRKVEIENDNTDLKNNDDDSTEQLVYQTNPDCLRAGKHLVEFDLSVGTLVFSFRRGRKEGLKEDSPFPPAFASNKLHDHQVPHYHLAADGQTRLPDLLHYRPSMSSSGNKKNNNNLENLYDGSLVTITCSNTSARYLRPPQDDWDVDLLEGDSANSANSNEKGNNVNKDHQLTNSNNKTTSPGAKEDLLLASGPNCSRYLPLDFSMNTFEHLPSVRDRKQLKIQPESEILSALGTWKSYSEFGADLNAGLSENSTSWLLYTLASFYWRGVGNAEQAIECVRRALHSSPAHDQRPLPLLSLATILHRARAFEEAAIVLHGAIDITPDIPHAHYTLGNIYATLADYNKSIICYENVGRLAPLFRDEITARKAAVQCHAHIEAALMAQHETLQKTLEELKDFQRAQELRLIHQERMLAERAPPSVLLEQRLHYREYKSRQRFEATLDEKLKQWEQQQQQQDQFDKIDKSKDKDKDRQSDKDNNKSKGGKAKFDNKQKLNKELDEQKQKFHIQASSQTLEEELRALAATIAGGGAGQATFEVQRLHLMIDPEVTSNVRELVRKIVAELEHQATLQQQAQNGQLKGQENCNTVNSAGKSGQKAETKSKKSTKSTNSGSTSSIGGTTLSNESSESESSGGSGGKKASNNKGRKKSPSVKTSNTNSESDSSSSSSPTTNDDVSQQNSADSNGDGTHRPILIPVTFVLPPS